MLRNGTNSSFRYGFRENFASIMLVLILTVGIAAFGADTPIASLVLSTCIFLTIILSCLIVPKFNFSPFVLSCLFFWAIFFTLSFTSGRVMGGEDEYLMLLAAIATFQVGQFAGMDRNRLSLLWLMLMFVGGAFAIFGFAQHFVSPNMSFGMPKPYHLNRLTGTFLSSNTAATFLGVTILLATVQFHRTWRRWKAAHQQSQLADFIGFIPKGTVPAIIILFAVVSLMLTASRAGLISFSIAVILFIGWAIVGKPVDSAISMRNRPAVLFCVSVIGFIALLYFWQLSGGVAQARYGGLMGDLSERNHIREASLIAVKYEPLFGHGLGRFSDAKLLGTTPANNIAVMSQNAAHNVIIQWLLQVGWVGLFTMGALILFVLKTIISNTFHGRRSQAYSVGILSITLLVFFHGMFDYALEIPAFMLFFTTCLGAGYGLASR